LIVVTVLLGIVYRARGPVSVGCYGTSQWNGYRMEDRMLKTLTIEETHGDGVFVIEKTGKEV
jgi:hypothetical protein